MQKLPVASVAPEWLVYSPVGSRRKTPALATAAPVCRSCTVPQRVPARPDVGTDRATARHAANSVCGLVARSGRENGYLHESMRFSRRGAIEPAPFDPTEETQDWNGRGLSKSSGP